jgi:hypothetical protein
VRGAATVAKVGFVVLIAAVASAQNTTVKLPPMRAGSIAGLVVDAAVAIVPHAKVALVDCPADRDGVGYGRDAIASTETDFRGKFSLGRGTHKPPYCLRVWSPRFNPIEFKVTLSRFAGRMRLVLPIAA